MSRAQPPTLPLRTPLVRTPLLRMCAAVVVLALATLASPLPDRATASPGSETVAGAAAGPACPVPSRAQPDPIPAGTLPVVLVHGWTGTAHQMNPIGEAISARFGDEVAVRYFDYHADSVRWAAEPHIASCLADYLHAASDQSGVPAVVVAHSMGGLAVRFASGAEFASSPITTDQVTEVVTIATPHVGSPWGGTIPAEAVQTFQIIRSRGAMPASGSAATCLAVHQGGRNLTRGCAAPPYLPPGVNVLQIEGKNTVHRDLFGHVLYSIDQRGDGIVLTDSATGYPGSAAPPLPTGYRLGYESVACDARASQQKGFLQHLLEGAENSLVGLWMRTLTDGPTMESILAGRLDALSAPQWAVTYLLSACAHSAIIDNPQTSSLITPAIERALTTSVTSVDSWTDDDLLNAALPVGTCGTEDRGWSHASPIQLTDGQGEARTAGGHFDGASVLSTSILGRHDIDGDGLTDAVLLLQCSGSEIAMCCAGRTSITSVVAVFSSDSRGRLTLAAPTIWGGASLPGNQYGPAQRMLAEAELDGNQVVTSEYLPYPESYTADQVGGDPYALISVRYILSNGAWHPIGD